MRYPVWIIHCCKRPNYDFRISQGSVATVLRWGGQNYSHLRLVSSWCCMPKIITRSPADAVGGRPYCPQSYKYNHAVRIWEVDAVGRQKIVIPSGIGLADVLAVGQVADWLTCASVYTVNCELCTASAQWPVPTAGYAHALWSRGPQ